MNPTYPPHRSLRQIRGCAPAAVDKSACVVPPPELALRLIAITAQRVAPSRHQADNPAGSIMPAACSDWHDVRRFHVGTDHNAHTRCRICDCTRFRFVKSKNQSLCFFGESIYEGLDRSSRLALMRIRTPNVNSIAQPTMALMYGWAFEVAKEYAAKASTPPQNQ